MKYLLFLPILGFIACSTTPPPIPITHPANQQAPAGITRPCFSGLRLDKETRTTQKLLTANNIISETTPEMTTPMDHSKMNHSEMDHSEMPSD